MGAKAVVAQSFRDARALVAVSPLPFHELPIAFAFSPPGGDAAQTVEQVANDFAGGLVNCEELQIG